MHSKIHINNTTIYPKRKMGIDIISTANNARTKMQGIHKPTKRRVFPMLANETSRNK
jgi:hypothetical protein